ncbi:fumarate reductase subunit C [Microlunatus elymi]|uniref:Fumarate reductase subunit C n=1 Tax=Microlunatus elymi TaxID=2596828 RepID=A0A516PYS7_9ACTN|nr:fumarate reductase subunit C [Microlunatus elymi]QDP96339.1 fumarate reductase subunit C [Microlunatus elymi]
MTVRDPAAQTGYRRPMSTWWWTKKGTYFLFVMRELSSLFVGWFVLYLLLLFTALARGESAFGNFVDWAGQPWVVIINVISFLFAALHTVTWFLLTPRAMVIKLGSARVSAAAIVAGQYVVLVAVSIFVWWLVVHD